MPESRPPGEPQGEDPFGVEKPEPFHLSPAHLDGIQARNERARKFYLAVTVVQIAVTALLLLGVGIFILRVLVLYR